MPDWFWYIPAPVVAVVYVIYYYSARRKEAAAVAADAHTAGWSYDTTDRGLERRYAGWPFDNRGRKVRHVVRGQHRGREFVAYEYSFRMHMGYQFADDGLLRNRCRYQVVSIRHGNSGVPDFLLTGADAAARVSNAIFGEFHSGTEEFNRKFSVAARDSAAVSVILADPLCEWLTADPRASENPLKFEAGDLVTWRNGAIDLGAASDSLDFLNDVIDRLPAPR